uniref:DUF2158 domain-containing protein n=1 Tax=Panacibacter microcysteis TaxID=2793269 RepID=A0A931DZI8_9BACT|nr:DUF2158 domain-containing protein [Panacibacter microcysteis]MBG9374655.1 DUF2158 domain-containing protein [Panacibacter microcysteis]
MKNEFKIGDVVVFKSGSPKFTISGIENNLVSIIYWNGTDIKTNGWFDYALTKVE